LIISTGVVIVVGLLAFVFWFAGSSSQTPSTNTQNVGLPIANSVGNTTTTVTGIATSTPDTGMSVAGAGGGAVHTNNFITDPTTVKDPINLGYYYLGYHVYEGISDSTATNNPPYIIMYISATQYFNVALLQEPIGATRTEAEQYLMAHLGISQDQMCKLNYMVSVPDHVNSQFAGKNLGFSFCPGATVLPK